MSSVIDALYAAVDASPGDSALRLHLARLLLGEGRAEDALLQAEEVLRASPADREALSVGADAAEQADLDERAAGYRRLLAALQSQRPSPEVGLLGSDSDAAENVAFGIQQFDRTGISLGHW